MKANIFLTAVFFISLFFGGCSTQGNDEKKLPMEIILDGTYSAIEDKREVLLNNNDDYQKLMADVYKNLDQMPRIPVVDFNKNSVVAVFIGNRSNGGFMVAIDSITETKNLTVNLTETTPGSTCIVTDAITRPFTLVKIPKTEAMPVFKTKQIVKECQ